MAKDAKTFLAASVLNESKLVSYRMLSRELKVHANLAKQFLYDFYTRQNSRKPGSIRATYLLCGYIRAKDPDEGVTAEGDSFIQSSPYMSSPATKEENEVAETPMQTVITLVKEEDLEEARSRYDHLSSIHIYSLGPTSLRNIQLLTECGRQVSVTHAKEDPLIHNKDYGIIQNYGVRRTGRRHPPPPAVLEPTPVPQAKTVSRADSGPSAPPKADSTASRPATPAAGDSRPSSSKGPVKKPALKKEQSDIFKSFAKKGPEKIKRDDTESSAAPSPLMKPQEDVTMQDPALSSSEEDDFVPPPTKQSKTSTSRPSRIEREEKLRQMMMDDDDDENPEETNEANEDSEMVDASSPSNPIDAPERTKARSPSPSAPAPEISNGRRRGRRKIMKKKTMKDAEGYLVTKEEPAWESFSEEDKPVAPPKPKVQVAVAKGRPTSSAKNQGNLMAFLGKNPKK